MLHTVVAEKQINKSDQKDTITSFHFSVKMYATSTARLASNMIEGRDTYGQGILLFMFAMLYRILELATFWILKFQLKILTRKKHPIIKLQRLQKIRKWTLGSLVHQIKSF